MRTSQEISKDIQTCAEYIATAKTLESMNNWLKLAKELLDMLAYVRDIEIRSAVIGHLIQSRKENAQ